MKYKITIQELNEYDEITTMYRNPSDPEKMYSSKYDFQEEVRDKLVSHQRPTGKKLNNPVTIFEQIVDDEISTEFNVKSVVAIVNNIK